MRLGLVILASVFLLLPGSCKRSLSIDAKGVVHGTGERIYRYKSGALQLQEDYVDGQLTRSRWFRPNGTLIQQTDWHQGTGEGLYLREEGSVRERLYYVNGVADGEARQYDEAGNVTKIERYLNGAPAPGSVAATTEATRQSP
jgi:antitoxin component YwqK of YwqJK toxin-antitoxin module